MISLYISCLTAEEIASFPLKALFADYIKGDNPQIRSL